MTRFRVDHAGMAFLLLELVPFIALVVVARRLGRWLTLGCAVAFGGLILETMREMSESSSSTAALAFVVLPFVLLALLLVVLAVNEGVRLLIRRRRGGTIRRPTRRELALLLGSPLVGLLVLSWFGLVTGLVLAFTVWSARSALAR
jgi:hypothetical protein